MVSHPQSDILECEVRGVLGSTAVNKASGCDGIPAELFKTLKDYTIKVLNYQSIKVLSTRKWSLDWKSQSSSIPKKDSPKECANHWTIAFTA